MKRVQIRFVRRNDCYVSLPEGAGAQGSQEYSDRVISRAVKLKLLSALGAEKVIYCGFNGLKSSKASEIEISGVFAGLNGVREGDFAEFELQAQGDIRTRLSLECVNSSDYEIVAMRRNELEGSLLNNITVLNTGLKFPLYYSPNHYVVLQFSDPLPGPFCLISPSSELSIITQNQQGREAEREAAPSEPLLVRVLELDDASVKAPFFYVSRELLEKYKISLEEPYKIHHKIIKRRNSLKHYTAYIRKIEALFKRESNQNKNKTTGSRQLYCYFKELPENHKELQLADPAVYIPREFRKTLRLERHLPLRVDLAHKINDFSKNYISTLADFLKLKSLKVCLFPLVSECLDANSAVKAYAEAMLHAITQGGLFVAYSEQIVMLEGSYFALKIPEQYGNNKSCLDMLAVKGRQGGSAESEEIKRSLETKIIVAKHHEIGINFLEKSISRFNRIIQKRLSQSQRHDYDMASIFFPETLDELRHRFTQIDKRWIGLLTSPSGNGKTTVVKRICKEFPQVPNEQIDFSQFSNLKNALPPPIDMVKVFLEEILQKSCMLGRQVVVILENLEVLSKNVGRIDFQQTQEILVSEVFTKYVIEMMRNYKSLRFLVVAEKKELLNEQLSAIFDHHWELKMPNFSKRKTFFEKVFLTGGSSRVTPAQIDELASRSENLSTANLDLLLRRVRGEAAGFELLLSTLNQISNKTYKTTSTFPKFEHVGGLSKVKELIKDTFEIPLKFEFLFKNIPIKLSSGILLYGPPGCGKTYIAAAAANELGMNFFSVKGPELLNKYIGASEQAVRDVFEKASNVKPSIIFFDEFDAIVPRRNSGSTNVTDRVVNQFLCYLDGVSSMQGVYILAATSRPDLIDPALLRPGRIDQHIYLGFPERAEREEILNIYFRNFNFREVTTGEISELTEGFTCSDLVALLKELQIKKAKTLLDNKENLKNLAQSGAEIKMEIDKEHFDGVFKAFRPALSKKDIVRYDKFYNDFKTQSVDVKQQKTTLH